eukprot:PhM_4_TR2831/c0_g1_i1/m.31603
MSSYLEGALPAVSSELVDALQGLRSDPVIQDILARKSEISASHLGIANTSSFSTDAMSGPYRSPLEALRQELRRYRMEIGDPESAAERAVSSQTVSDRQRTIRTVEELDAERRSLREEMAMILDHFIRDPPVAEHGTGTDPDLYMNSSSSSNPARRPQATGSSVQAARTSFTNSNTKSLATNRAAAGSYYGAPAPELTIAVRSSSNLTTTSHRDPDETYELKQRELEEELQQDACATEGAALRSLKPSSESGVPVWVEEEKRFLKDEIEHRTNEIAQLCQQLEFRRKLREEENAAVYEHARAERMSAGEQVRRMEQQLTVLIEETEKERAQWQAAVRDRISAVESYIKNRTKAHAAETQRLVLHHDITMRKEVENAKKSGEKYVESGRQSMRARSEERVKAETEVTERLTEKERAIYLKEAERVLRDRIDHELTERFISELEPEIRASLTADLRNELKKSLRDEVRARIEQELRAKVASKLLEEEQRLKQDFEVRFEAIKTKHRAEVSEAQLRAREDAESNMVMTLKVQQDRYEALRGEVEALTAIQTEKELQVAQLTEEGEIHQQKAQEELAFEKGVSLRLAQEVETLRQDLHDHNMRYQRLQDAASSRYTVSVTADFPYAETEEDRCHKAVQRRLKEYNAELTELKKLVEERECDARPGGIIRTPKVPPGIAQEHQLHRSY